MKFLKESLLLLIAFAIAYAWQQTFLADYTIHTLVVLTLIYLILTARKKEFNLIKGFGDSLSIFILIVMILLLVFATGGFTSTLFFLLYFLAFGITFAFEPITVFVFVILVTLIFLPDALNDDIVGNFLHLGSLYLIAPFAFFFGRELKKDREEQKTLSTAKKRSKKKKK